MISGKLRLWSAAAACAGLFMTQAAGAHPAAFTLNDVMQAPFASDLLAAPTGAALAWVFNAKGCSNIWIADSSRRTTKSCSNGTIIVIIMNLCNFLSCIKIAAGSCFCGNLYASCDAMRSKFP